MAASPSFVGDPRTTNKALSSAAYLLQTCFTAGAGGSVVKTLMASCIADQQLYATIMLVAGGVSHFLATVPLRATAISAAADGQMEPALNLLDPAYVQCLRADFPYLELGADELLKISLTTVDGSAPSLGEAAHVRTVGADY